MRDSINKYKTIKDPDYCVRVTSDEGDVGRAYLERFQDNDKTLPTILTSSQMLTTGVDALNVRNIVLVRNIGSIVEYKQIIGRGTRLYDGKDFFTILDFVGATNEFRDEIWDGGEDITEPEPKTPPVPRKPRDLPEGPTEPKEPTLIVELDAGREVKVIDIETRYIDPETGKLLSAKDFLMKLVDRLPMFYKDEAQLRKIWSNPDSREELLVHLTTIGIGEEQLQNLSRMFEAENSDIFDILAHLSYGTDIRYRTERRDIASSILDEYESLDARAFIEFLFTLYVRNGIREFRKDGLSGKIGLFGRTPKDLATVFGSNAAVKEVYYRVQEGLYVK